MKSLSVTFLALLGLSVLAVSCGEDTAKKLSSSNSKTTQFLESTKTAVTNIAQSLDNLSFAASCTAAGTPTAGSLSDAYNKDAFPCALGTDTKDFNTPKEIMSVFSGLMCAIENQVPFNYNTSVTTHTLVLDRLDSCLSGLSFTNANSFTVVVKEQALINNSTWTYKITVDFSNEVGMSLVYASKQVVIYLRENGNETATKVSIGTAGNPNFLGMAIQEDSSTNTLRFDMMAENKHFRAVVEGSSASYNGINSMRGAHSISNGCPVRAPMTQNRS